MPNHVKAAAPKVKGKFIARAANQSRVGGPSNTQQKRKRPSAAKHVDDDDDDDDDDADSGADNEMSEGSNADDGEEYDEEEEGNTDDEIAAAHAGKSRKTSKRKRRATSPNTFGAALQGLLGGDVEEAETATTTMTTTTQPAILSLAPHVRRGAQSSRLNAKAARIALAARRRREDRAHVTDVIGGWGAPGELPKTSEGEEKPAAASDATGEEAEAEQMKAWLAQGGVQGYEKRLRKVAQRGVVKLFNAIRAAQNTNEENLEDGQAKANPAAVVTTKSSKKVDTPLGGKAKAVNELSKNNFFDLLRAGTKAV